MQLTCSIRACFFIAACFFCPVWVSASEVGQIKTMPAYFYSSAPTPYTEPSSLYPSSPPPLSSNLPCCTECHEHKRVADEEKRHTCRLHQELAEQGRKLYTLEQEHRKLCTLSAYQKEEIQSREAANISILNQLRTEQHARFVQNTGNSQLKEGLTNERNRCAKLERDLSMAQAQSDYLASDVEKYKGELVATKRALTEKGHMLARKQQELGEAQSAHAVLQQTYANLCIELESLRTVNARTLEDKERVMKSMEEGGKQLNAQLHQEAIQIRQKTRTYIQAQDELREENSRLQRELEQCKESLQNAAQQQPIDEDIGFLSFIKELQKTVDTLTTEKEKLKMQLKSITQATGFSCSLNESVEYREVLYETVRKLDLHKSVFSTRPRNLKDGLDQLKAYHQAHEFDS